MQSVHEKIEKEKEVEKEKAIEIKIMMKEGGETVDDSEQDKDSEEEEQSDFEEDNVAEAKQHWRSFAETLVRQKVVLFVEPRSESILADQLKDTKICSPDEGGQEKRRAFIYDSKTVGESKTHPHLRFPPHKANHIMKMIQGALKARQEDPSGPLQIASNDCYIFFDATKHCTLLRSDSFAQWLVVVVVVFCCCCFCVCFCYCSCSCCHYHCRSRCCCSKLNMSL